MLAFKIQLLLLGVLRLARGQFMDPVLGPLAPLPNHLIAIRGPLFVDASSLVPMNPMAGPVMGGPPMMGPPVQAMGPPVQPMMGPPMMGPPPMGGGFVQVAYDETNDPVNQRPAPSRRSANTNVQSGIQQFGTGNMNLQGNIQQVSQP